MTPSPAPLTPGVHVGPYEIVAPLGAGGMGEVWRARDPRLGREVAIKVMPPALAHDPERRARFERECRLLASLAHPNVAGVLGLEDAGGAPALIMELVEGPTLAERIAGGPLDLADALVIARQIAEGVEYAHEKGIVHRDLKPANVKLTPEGAVKVLDFGLAKALAADDGSSSSSMIAQSPTISLGTNAGVLLGTAAYMSPEQARGRAVDRRADIWAFGVVLLEMLTGEQAFAGETVSDTIARILERQPDLTALPARTPARVRELLRRCLEKDAKQRLRDIGDARLELDAAIAQLASGIVEAPGGANAVATGRSRRSLVFAAVGLAALALGFVLRGVIGGGGDAPGRGGPLRVSVVPPADLVFATVNFGPHGDLLLASGVPPGESAAKRQLYRRDLDGFEWKAIPGTDGVAAWDQSHDGRWLYLVRPVAPGSRQESLQRVALDGATPPATLMPWPDSLAAWDVLPDERIAVVSRDARRFAVLSPASTEPATWKPIVSNLPPLTELGMQAALADGRTALTVPTYYSSIGWTQSVARLDLESGKLELLIEDASYPWLTDDGVLLASRRGTLLAAPWNPKQGRLAAKPVTVLEGLRTREAWEHARVAVSPGGDLAYVSGGAVTQHRYLAVAHPNGSIEPWSEEQGAFERTPGVSPDGRLVATIAVPPGTSYYELLILERGRPGRRRFASHENEDLLMPRFSPDGRMLAWLREGAEATAGIWVQPVDGSAPARMLTRRRGPGDLDAPLDWAPDGRSLLVQTTADAKTWIRRIALDGDPPAVTDVIRESHNVTGASLAPDGRRIAYETWESGEGLICVASLQPDGRVGTGIPVSRASGTEPQWTDGGRTVVWGTPDRTIMEATVSPALEVSAPRKRVEASERMARPSDYTALPNGDIVFTHRAEGEGDVRSFDLVLGFRRELAAMLKQAGPAKR